jgi:DNA polymerase I
MTWASIAEQLRSIGVDVPLSEPRGPAESSTAKSSTERSPPQATVNVGRSGTFLSSCRVPRDSESLWGIIKASTIAGVTFFERIVDGELVAEGLSRLAPDSLQALTARWDEIRSELLPAVSSTASIDLLADLGIELVFIDDEIHAAEEVGRICEASHTLGLDIETAPRPEFLPTRWPIKITKDGQRSKIQTTMDTSAGLDPFRAEMRLLQVAAEIEGRTVALVIDLRRVPLGSASLASLWRCRLVGHNLSFDAKMLLANGIEIPDENVVDTILMSGLVLRGVADRRREGSRRPSLAEAVKEALGLELPKNSQLSPWWRERLSEEQIAYAALDAVIALRLAAALQPRIDKLPIGPDGKGLIDRLYRAVIPVARMELAGVTLNHDELAKQADAWDQELQVLSAEIVKLGIGNPSSSVQIASWLCRQLQRLDDSNGTNWISTWPRTDSGALSTKAKHLRRIVNALPEAELLVRYSELAQLSSNFGEKLINRISSHTGRLHGSFLIAMAKSGRFSSSNPNLQNIPKSKAMRSVFIAAPGKTLVVADYSQLELRVMAEIAKDKVMTEAYRDGLDLHAVTAAGMLGLEPREFDGENPTHREARQKAKAVNFGVIYGSGPGGLREFARDAYNLQMSTDEARRVIDGFLATYPGVARWQWDQENRSRQTMTVSTAGGRIYRFAWEPNGEHARNLALNLPVQGTAAEIAVDAMIRIDARLRAELGPKGKLVLQVHDEFVIEVDEDENAVEFAKQVLKEEMVAAFQALLPGAPTTGLVDAHAGPNWAAAKE